MTSDPFELSNRKQQLRARARAYRHAQLAPDVASRRICEKLVALPEYSAARAVLFYVSFGDEVRTVDLLQESLGTHDVVVVPYCEGDSLGLFCLKSLDELSPGTWDILEPLPELRARKERCVEVESLDLVLVPGVAFDRKGGRIGHGKGYYDKLLATAKPRTSLVALAFDCQMVDEVPMLAHDVFMHKVITERTIYQSGEPSPG